ncbi:MAG: SpoIIE family protein phosphatase [Candidatus Angelobacter sp.]
MFRSVAIQLTDATSVGEARRAGQRLGSELGFSEIKNGELGLIVTEAARNAVSHAGGGELVISTFRCQDALCADVLALDQGQGISDLGRAFQDGYSTLGTPGEGLGAIRRMGSQMDVFSGKSGTALFARVMEGDPAAEGALEIGGIAAPYPGETVCGDAMAWEQKRGRTVIVMADGLGHGPLAAEAAAEAVASFRRHASEQPGEMVARMHDALKKTRGAAASVAEIRPLAGTLTYAGVGNIAATVLSSVFSRSLVSHGGTLGHTAARIQEFKMEWPRGAALIMHSDGLKTRWDLSAYPGLLARKPALIAGVLFRDFKRGRDDASVVVVKSTT